MGRENHGCGEEYNIEKREKGKQCHLPYNIETVGRNIKCGKRVRGQNSKFKKKRGVEKDIELKGTLYTPGFFVISLILMLCTFRSSSLVCCADPSWKKVMLLMLFTNVLGPGSRNRSRMFLASWSRS